MTTERKSIKIRQRHSPQYKTESLTLTLAAARRTTHKTAATALGLDKLVADAFVIRKMGAGSPCLVRDLHDTRATL